MLFVGTSQIISWCIMVPNSVIWYWSLYSKVQVFFSSLRLWVLVLIGVNATWDLVVQVDEPWAYEIASSTYVSTMDIIIISAIVTATMSTSVLEMAEIKWAAESQRVNDGDSFQEFIAHANTYQPELEEYETTPISTLWIIYGPLIQIVFVSVLCVFALAALRWIFVTKSYDRIVALFTKRPLEVPSPPAPYMRLSIEEELNCAIRARCLVRNQLEMEIEAHGFRYLKPNCYLEFGWIPTEGFVDRRMGFLGSRVRRAPL